MPARRSSSKPSSCSSGVAPTPRWCGPVRPRRWSRDVSLPGDGEARHLEGGPDRGPLAGIPRRSDGAGSALAEARRRPRRSPRPARPSVPAAPVGTAGGARQLRRNRSRAGSEGTPGAVGDRRRGAELGGDPQRWPCTRFDLLRLRDSTRSRVPRSPTPDEDESLSAEESASPKSKPIRVAIVKRVPAEAQMPPRRASVAGVPTRSGPPLPAVRLRVGCRPRRPPPDSSGRPRRRGARAAPARRSTCRGPGSARSGQGTPPTPCELRRKYGPSLAAVLEFERAAPRD